MKPKISVITLSVADLEKLVALSRDGLCLPFKGILGTEHKGTASESAGAVGFFELLDGLILALYPRTELAKNANLGPALESSLEFSVGYLAESREEVDQIVELHVASESA